MVSLFILLKKKWLFSKIVFIVPYTFALIPLTSPMNLITSNLLFILEAITLLSLNKHKKPKRFVCQPDPYFSPIVLLFYSSTSFKISQIHSGCGFKISFKSFNIIKLSFPKYAVPTENRYNIYLIPLFFL